MSYAVVMAKHFKTNIPNVHRGWIAIWCGFALLLSLAVAISGDYHLLWLIWGQCLVAIIAHFLFGFTKAFVSRLFLLLLSLAALLTSWGWFYGANGFYDTDKSWLALRSLSPLNKVLLGQGSQTWQVEADKDLVWSFEARLTEGITGWDWRKSDPSIQLSRMEDAAGAFTRVRVPEAAEELYLSRLFSLDKPIEGRSFKLHLGLRSQALRPNSAYIAITGAENLAFSPVAEWRLNQTQWTVKGEDSQQIRVLLRQINGLEFDLRELRLFEKVEGKWLDLGPGVGSEMRVGARNAVDGPLTFKDIIPSKDWQKYSLAIEDNAADKVTTFISLGEGIKLQVRNSQLAYTEEQAKSPGLLQRDLRQRLWFSNENLTAHSITAVGLVFLMSVNSIGAAIWGFGALVLSVFLTGSRTALLVVGLGGAVFLMLLFKRKGRLQVFYSLSFVAAVFVLTSFIRFGPDFLHTLGLNTEQVVSRLDIWQVAWEGFLRYPLTGLPQQDFTSYFAQQHPEAPPTLHAHNFWLELAVSYGIFGLLASLLLTVYISYFAWKRGRWEGLTLVVSFFVLQILDTTLLFSGVLLVFIWGLNLLAKTTSSEAKTVSG